MKNVIESITYPTYFSNINSLDFVPIEIYLTIQFEYPKDSYRREKKRFI